MSSETNYSYLDRDSIYAECVRYQPSNFELVVQCDPLLFIGFMSAGLIPLTAMFFVLLGIILLIKLITLPKLFANQKHFGCCFFLTDMMIFTIIGFLFLFCIRGLAWIGLSGYYIHNKGDLGCRIMSFLMAFANTTPANVLLFTNLNAWLATLLPGYHPTRTTIQLLVICFILSFVYALPEVCVNRLWQFDGQLYCGTNPAQARLVLFHAELHRILYGHGFVQATLTLICLIKLSGFNTEIKRTMNCLFGVAMLRSSAVHIIRQVGRILYQTEQTVRLIIIHSFLLSILIFIRVFTHIWISLEFYDRVNQVPRVQAHFRLYSYWATRDHLSWAIMILAGYHLWFYVWHIPRIKIQPVDEDNGDKSNVDRYLQPITGVSPTTVLNRWEHVMSILDQMDMDAYPPGKTIQDKLRKCIDKLKAQNRT